MRTEGKLTGTAVTVLVAVLSLGVMAAAAEAGTGDLDKAYGRSGFAKVPKEFETASIIDVQTVGGGGLIYAGAEGNGSALMLGKLDHEGVVDEDFFGTTMPGPEFPWVTGPVKKYQRAFWDLARSDEGFIASVFGRQGNVIAGFDNQGRGAIFENGYINTSGYESLAENQEGSIITVGYRGVIQVRKPDGILDRRFSGDGEKTLNSRAAGCRSYFRTSLATVAVDREDRYVIAGSAETCRNRDFSSRSFVVRLLPDGRLDRSFGPARDGFSYGPPGYVSEMRLTPIGAPVLAVSKDDYEHDSKDRAMIMKLRLDGRKDRQFAGNGILRQKNVPGVAFSLGLGDERRIFAIAGIARSSDDRGYRTLVSCFRFNGALDRSFGEKGRTVIPGLNLDVTGGAAVDGNGQLYIAGFRGSFGTAQPYVVRLQG